MAAATFHTIPPTATHYSVEQSWEANLLRTYPELRYLADDQVRITQEGVASQDPSPSVHLFGKKYPEFDRTLLTIRSLEMILAGKYDQFVAGQTGPDQLTRASFFELQYRGELLLHKLGMAKEVMIAALVFGDMGKCGQIRQQFPQIEEPDHDDFEREWLRVLSATPELSPTYERLGLEARGLIDDAAGLAHFGHIFHQEGGAEMFARLAATKHLGQYALEFALFIQRCDVAGALGHVNPTSSLAFTQKAYDGYEAVEKACRAVYQENATAESIYQAVLEARGELCGFAKDEVLLIRLAAMMRLTTREEGALLREALAATPDKTPLPCPPLTATYMPAVLVNKMNATSGDLRAKITAAVTWGLPLLQAGLALECPPGVRHCFNKLAGQAKEAVTGTVVVVDQEGNVTLIGKA